ncbi:N-acetylmuramoyl-L-alanine amidase [Clostridium butyricum]|uniref:Cell wall hydrolase/autolysin n=1 Tax=Clostridium butyricum E4 str. BoNT E BL5262 TaxID=632245 RepID=C4IKR0_CLOBU|nr:N-acetylmuramoyl-L-alanine amidase [Clostridium butyricum]APF23949.1 N-acetylmuramoyl-L-alanine amidase family protein [Clostridium butyricum]EDT75128.1 peptidoglycan-binding domain 1 [Clostridium butyricum 5521]EEP53745.1 cell wall hydrolase/autolysin [Clostridium butyricum E4 str. BoNT E BL5262]NFL32914.1 N-acetylmuramoyl-L-alanine amidase [Clostridium butyricum]NFS20270.1 N-acetylmuramoyl-L-alanine amidase [Clostridium butyricum]
MSKFLISVGHTASGNVGCGATGYLNESNCTREIAPLVVAKLKALGYEAVKLQIDNADQYDYVKRAQQANSIGGDMFVEIHLNAGCGSGCEVFTTNGSKAYDSAVRVSEALSERLGIPNRGYKTTRGLYVLNNTTMSAMLIEACFVDNEADYKAYNAETIANAIVEGLTGQVSENNTGWHEDSKGWWYVYANNSYPKSTWFKVGKDWYYADEAGYCYQNMWLKDKDKWYYFKDNCKMACGETLTYSFNSNGEWI